MAQRQRAWFPGYTVEEMHHWHQTVEEMQRSDQLASWSDYEAGGPLTRYLYLNSSEFGSQALILRAGPVSDLPVALDDRFAEHSVTTRQGTLTLDDYVYHPESGVDGVVVVQRGRIVYEAYPRMRPLDKHLLMSTSKTFVGLLVALLIERGQVEEHAPIERYLPELTDSGWAGTSIRDLLNHASGIDSREGESGSYHNPENPHYKYEASLGASDISTYAYMAEYKRARPTGERYEYASVNTFVLAWLAERMTNLPFHELISREVWQKIGAEGDAMIGISPLGAPNPHGGLYTNTRDLARFGLLYTPSWPVVSQERIVTPWYLDRIRHDGRSDIFESASFDEVYGEDRPPTRSWHWHATWTDGDIFHPGYQGQGLFVSTVRDMVVAYFGSVEVQGPWNELRAIARRLSVELGS
jgi:CubicO group peptidase (beta-lactamase class C family)